MRKPITPVWLMMFVLLVVPVLMVKFIINPVGSIRAIPWSLRKMRAHHASDVGSMLILFGDYLVFDGLTLATSVAMEDGVVSGKIIEPLDPIMSSVYREFHPQ